MVLVHLGEAGWNLEPMTALSHAGSCNIWSLLGSNLYFVHSQPSITPPSLVPPFQFRSAAKLRAQRYAAPDSTRTTADGTLQIRHAFVTICVVCLPFHLLSPCLCCCPLPALPPRATCGILCLLRDNLHQAHFLGHCWLLDQHHNPSILRIGYSHHASRQELTP